MAIELNDNIYSKVNRPTDFRFGPFTSIAQANSIIPIAQRYHGLLFGVYTTPLNLATSDITFHYYWDGLTDSDVKSLISTSIISGAIGSGQIAFGTGVNTIGGENALFWNSTTNRLGINNSTPSYPLDINGSGEVAVIGVKSPLNITSDATTRLRIDSTQAVPNAGVGLYANGVAKFSFAMFGATNDFTIYNDSLTAASILIKGNTNNFLVATTVDGGQKFQVAGSIAIRASATASTSTQILVFNADPSSTTTQVLTRTPTQLRSDIGAQATLTNPVTGTGTTNTLSKFTGASTIGNSIVTDDGTVVTINGNTQVTGQVYSPVNAKGNSGTAVTFNWNEGNIQTVTMTGSATFTFNNPQSGASYQIIITQDVTGGRTITWPTIHWAGKTVPSLTGTTLSKDIVTLTYDGVNYNGVISKNHGV